MLTELSSNSVSVLCIHLWLTPYSRGGQTVDHGQLFGRLWPLFGLYQNLFAASVQSVAVRLTGFFGSTYLCKETFSQIKIIKSSYRNCLTDEHLKYCLHLCVSNYEPSSSKLLQDTQCRASTLQEEVNENTL